MKLSLGVLPERHRFVHSLALSTQRPELSGEDELIDRDNKRHSSDENTDKGLKQCLNRVSIAQ